MSYTVLGQLERPEREQYHVRFLLEHDGGSYGFSEELKLGGNVNLNDIDSISNHHLEMYRIVRDIVDEAPDIVSLSYTPKLAEAEITLCIWGHHRDLYKVIAKYFHASQYSLNV